jgi:putative membrane protein
VVNAVAIWVATLVVPGIGIGGEAGDGVWQQVLTFLVLGAVFGLLNAVVKPIVKFFTFPLYLLTLGLFSFVVNALMLQATSWISEATPLTFRVDDFFWSAVLAAVVVTFVSMVLNLVLPDGRDD